MSLTVLIDTREQIPFEFKGLPCAIRKLDYGDYTAVGLKSVLAVERKSVADLWSTLATKKNFERFRRELYGAQAVKVKLWIVVEGSALEVVSGNNYSLMNGYRLLDRLHQVAHEYGASVSFGGTRQGAEILTLSILRAACEVL